MREITVNLPYAPRPIQREIHTAIESIRFAVLVAHRRMGKTVLSVNQLIMKALKEGKADGFYGYIAPFRNQAKNVAWNYVKRYTVPLTGRHVNESELCVTLPGGAGIRLFGADNPDALRGMYFDGIVVDEVGQVKREVWDEILRPALADRNGWALFIGTPKGVNLFHDLYLKAQSDPEWESFMYRVGDTDALPQTEVDKLRSEMSENAFRQEFLCDFTASSDDVLITIDEAITSSKLTYMPQDYVAMPLVFGVDVARFGDDRSVIFMRRGLVAESPHIYQGIDNVALAQKIISLYHRFKPHTIFVDAGQGQGVIDIINKVLPNVVEVPFGGSALDETKFLNRRSEMWYLMREWIRAQGQIPDMPELVTEISAPMYSFNVKGKIQLEKKEDIKSRIGRSPDLADALALTFALPILPELERRQQFAITKTNMFEDYEIDPRQRLALGVSPSLV